VSVKIQHARKYNVNIILYVIYSAFTHVLLPRFPFLAFFYKIINFTLFTSMAQNVMNCLNTDGIDKPK